MARREPATRVASTCPAPSPRRPRCSCWSRPWGGRRKSAGRRRPRCSSWRWPFASRSGSSSSNGAPANPWYAWRYSVPARPSGPTSVRWRCSAVGSAPCSSSRSTCSRFVTGRRWRPGWRSPRAGSWWRFWRRASRRRSSRASVPRRRRPRQHLVPDRAGARAGRGRRGHRHERVATRPASGAARTAGRHADRHGFHRGRAAHRHTTLRGRQLHDAFPITTGISPSRTVARVIIGAFSVNVRRGSSAGA
jgi:hypothetical protein